MDDIQESFTRRILRRVSQRRERDRAEAMKPGSELSLRRFKILRAIEDSSGPRGSSIPFSGTADYHEGSDDDGFRDSFNLTGYSRNDDNNNNDEKSINVNTKFSESFGNANNNFSSSNDVAEEEETPILLKITEGHIEVPAKMIAQLKNIEGNTPLNSILDYDLVQPTQSSVSDLSTSTNEPAKNREGRNAFTTKAVVEMCQRVSSILTDIRCDYADPRDFELKKCSSITSSRFAEEIGSRSATFVKEILDRPIMESTRKSATFIKETCDRSTMESPKKSAIDSLPAKHPSSCTNREARTEEIYDEETFLNEALGKDRYDAASTQMDSRTISNLTGIVSTSEAFSPLQMRVMRALNLSKIETPPRSFGTLDRSMRIYRTVSQRIKKKLRSSLAIEDGKGEETPTIPSRFDDVDRIQELLQEVKIQQTVMNQATKALDHCKSVKAFVESYERVESERILLLASLRGKAALEEIKWITSEDNVEEQKIVSERGEVTIADISLDLRECLRSKIREEEVNEYFVVVVTQGLRVWSTRPITSGIGEKRLNFTGRVSIANLTPGFKIRIEVYSLKLRRNTQSYEDEYRNGENSCLSYNIFAGPKRFFRTVDHSSGALERCNSVLKTMSTSFTRCGYTELMLNDLSVSSPWALKNVPTNSKLRGTIDLNLACRLHFSMSHEGFLNHGDESGGLATWNRRWCVLRGHTLKFWNYPREQETKEPLKVIELINCVSNEVTTVDRAICAKPRTLLIETKRPRSTTDRNSILVECKPACTILRNLLSYDTTRELNKWSRKLNEVIVALEEWNVIGPRSQSLNVSDL